jgi:hypothetical protein
MAVTVRSILRVNFYIAGKFWASVIMVDYPGQSKLCAARTMAAVAGLY